MTDYLTITTAPPPTNFPEIAEAQEAMSELSGFLENYPVIDNAEDARRGAGYANRTAIALAEMEKARKQITDPLNQQLGTINGFYRDAREPLQRAFSVLKNRLSAYALAEEEKRLIEAARARAAAEAAERLARAAEAAEQETIDDAAQGVLTDTGGAIAAADAAFRDFQRAAHLAQVAERDAKVRLTPDIGSGKAMTLRSTEVVVVADPVAAISALWPNEEIAETLCKVARAWRKINGGKLPAGFSIEMRRAL